MKSSKNVLICWDYTNLDFNFDFSGYEKFYLIAYSAGVFTAGFIENKLPVAVCKIAVNGNPLFTDEYFGIPANVRQVFKSINLNNYMDFRKNYLVINDEELKYFNANASQRSFESCFEELVKLEELAKNNKKIMNFDCAILADSDKIFTPAHQREYFKDIKDLPVIPFVVTIGNANWKLKNIKPEDNVLYWTGVRFGDVYNSLEDSAVMKANINRILSALKKFERPDETVRQAHIEALRRRK